MRRLISILDLRLPIAATRHRGGFFISLRPGKFYPVTVMGFIHKKILRPLLFRQDCHFVRVGLTCAGELNG